MYIIYREHIFVYIFPCCFNWDSSFVTEVFFSQKVPLQTEALCSSSFSVKHSGQKKRLFWLICTEKSNQEGAGRLILTPPPPELDRPLWCVQQPARGTGGHFQTPTGRLSNWLRQRTNQKATVRIPPPSANRREDDNVKSVTSSCCRRPESRPSACSLTLLHWLWVRSH